MMQNFVTGCVVAVLIIMGLLVYAHEKHGECLHGRIFKTHIPCGSVSPSI
jgi:hypothetical protein